MDCCRYSHDGCEGKRIPTCEVRILLPIPPSHAVRIPSEMVSAEAVPADSWRTGYVCAVDFLRLQGCPHEGSNRGVDHARFRPPRLDELPCSLAGAAW